MEEALRALLLGAAPIATRVAGRVDWGLRPAGDPLPAISLFTVSGMPMMTMSGTSGWSRYRVQIDCWGVTYRDARDLGNAIAGDGGLLAGFRGNLRGARLRTLIISRRADSDTDGQDPVYRDSVDVAVWHTSLTQD